jgi:Cation efflux family
MGAEGAIAVMAWRARWLDRLALVRSRLGDRGVRQPRDRLALHRLALALARGRGAGAELVAIQFFLLMPYVAFEAVHKLVTSEQPETSWIGIALVGSSVMGMPFLGIAKRRLADTLCSVATRGEGTQNLLCAYLAAAVLVGLLGNALLGLWWLDPAAALVVAAVAVREARESWRGEGCCSTC